MFDIKDEIKDLLDDALISAANDSSAELLAAMDHEIMMKHLHEYLWDEMKLRGLKE